MNKKSLYILFILGSLLLSSCSYFNTKETKTPVAKVGNAYLYEEDLPEMNTETKAKEDSLIAVKKYIDKWALTNLLLDKAKFNLPKEKQTEFTEMAEQYRIQLYINAYKDALVEKNLNREILADSILNYYEKNKENFRLKENLLKLRYLVIQSDLKDVDVIKSKFSSFTNEDIEYLQAKNLEFKSQMLNDSVWVRFADVKSQMRNIASNLDAITERDTASTLVFKDSIFSYFIYIKQMKKANEIPPISYLKPTIQQILENKKKLELNKQIEKDIINDAIQNNEYKTY